MMVYTWRQLTDVKVEKITVQQGLHRVYTIMNSSIGWVLIGCTSDGVRKCTFLDWALVYTLMALFLVSKKTNMPYGWACWSFVEHYLIIRDYKYGRFSNRNVFSFTPCETEIFMRFEGVINTP